MMLMTWVFAKTVGKKRYDVARVEKKIETNESSLKLRAAIPMIRAFARKKRMTGMSGKRMVSGTPAKRVIAAEMRIMIVK
ncbi:MAG: hypothetical protein XD82_0416 [Methanoculleus marisnigri]|uniref:Uncharacterized protein n=1 Tax=Methanoculleus marisnigri TaxID=2198 RepID=A0A117LRD7_9EURY|nr:MAG: hypothetical protein XD82_0416 [Methanoculleus marisnigri]